MPMRVPIAADTGTRITRHSRRMQPLARHQRPQVWRLVEQQRSRDGAMVADDVRRFHHLAGRGRSSPHLGQARGWAASSSQTPYPHAKIERSFTTAGARIVLNVPLDAEAEIESAEQLAASGAFEKTSACLRMAFAKDGRRETAEAAPVVVAGRWGAANSPRQPPAARGGA